MTDAMHCRSAYSLAVIIFSSCTTYQYRFLCSRPPRRGPGCPTLGTLISSRASPQPVFSPDVAIQLSARIAVYGNGQRPAVSFLMLVLSLPGLPRLFSFSDMRSMLWPSRASCRAVEAARQDGSPPASSQTALGCTRRPGLPSQRACGHSRRHTGGHTPGSPRLCPPGVPRPRPYPALRGPAALLWPRHSLPGVPPGALPFGPPVPS